MVFCGSHDRHVYCWRMENDRESRKAWQAELDSEVYSIPFVGLVKIRQSEHNSISIGVEGSHVVCVSSSAGWLYALDATSGKVLSKIELPWDIFSSPVLLPDRKIVFGCRNDNLYCVSTELMFIE